MSTAAVPDQEPAPAALANPDSPVVVDGHQQATGRQHRLSVTLLDQAGAPLVNQAVQIVDLATGQAVGAPLSTDDQGHLQAAVPEDRAYGIRILDPDHDPAPAPEEAQPFQPDQEDGVRLYVRLQRPDAAPHAGIDFQLDGMGLSLAGRTGPDGDLEVDGCAAGAYDLKVLGQLFRVHTLCDSDLASDPDPYRLVVVTPAGLSGQK